MRLHIAGNGPDDRLLSRKDMKIHLADTPSPMHRLVLAFLANHPYRLYSYWYVREMPDPRTVIGMTEKLGGTIIDSGLFSLMFGSEQGALPSTYEAYRDYTRQYLDDLDKWGYKGFVVESDTHRLLGMEATLRLREEFKSLGSRVMYVWHAPEGLDGLEKLAVERDYICISIPELRMIGESQGGSSKVMRMCNDLLRRAHEACKRAGVLPPRIHLLGCTVEKMMQTPLAWSCDSTSWLSGVRYGQGYIWTGGGGLKSVAMSSPRFAKYREIAKEANPEAVRYAESQDNAEYYFNTLACAHAFAQYQRWLDTQFTHVPMRGTDGEEEVEVKKEGKVKGRRSKRR